LVWVPFWSQKANLAGTRKELSKGGLPDRTL
jgi:hypothetical protein